MIERFYNQTTPGNEKAIKRGKTVPDGAVNLAWAKSPTMSPNKNMIVVDTAAVTPENIENPNPNVYYANNIGVLEDINGNLIVADEYPAVTDEFSIEGDITDLDMSTEFILPYVHVSRFFHVDLAGLVAGAGLSDFFSPIIKVVDASGNLYTDSEGNPRFRIKAVPVYAPWPGVVGSSAPTQYAYRIWVFIDQIPDADFYVTYNKIELTSTGNFTNQDINHKEVINPRPYFENRPEEGEVVDPANREEKWYSSSSIALKDEILDLPVTNIDGYKIYVPKKAVNDPRIFQLFRWRVTCTFTQNFEIGTRVDHPINVGVVVTNADPTSDVAQTWNFVAADPINTVEAVFANPLSAAQSPLDKEQDSYWYVNFDTVTNTQLQQFDMLIWAPHGPSFDFSNYIGKIQYFTNTLGRVLLIETNGFLVPTGLGIDTTAGTTPQTGAAVNNTAGSNNPVPTNSSYDMSTWLPHAFLGIVTNVANHNPVPPSGSSWLSTALPAFGNYISYQACDGNIYWMNSTIRADHRVGNVDNSNNYVYPTTVTGWVPPLYAAVTADTPNPVPPSGSGWTQGTGHPTSNYISFVATDNNTYWHALPVGGSVATTGPTATLTGTQIQQVVDYIQRYIPNAYPNFQLTGGVNIGTNTDPALLTQIATSTTPTVLSGTVYNWPTSSTNLSTYLPPPPIRASVINSDNSVSYGTSSNIFDASALNGWTIDNTVPISYFQTAFGTGGAKIQYIYDSPPSASTLISGQIITMTTSTVGGSFGLSEGGMEGLIEGDASTTTTIVDGVQYTTVTQTTDYTYGSGTTAGSLTNGDNPGTILFGNPTIPDGATITSVSVNTSTNYSGATGGLNTIIAGGTVTTTNGGWGSTTDSSGTLNQTYTVTNGSGAYYTTDSGQLGNQYGLEISQLGTTIGSVNGTVSVTYATPVYDFTYYSPVSYAAPVPQLDTVPVFSAVPLVVENNGLIFSTFGIPNSVIMGLPGPAQLLLNIVLLATANRSLYEYKETQYASSFTYSSPWINDWTINTTDNLTVMSDVEKANYNFFYLPKDASDPTLVWQKLLSSKTVKQLIDDSLTEDQRLKILGANRNYVIEISNSLVKAAKTVGDHNYVYAWTTAYTPALVIPPDIKTYIVREIELKGSYSSGQYVVRTYPEKPYRCQARMFSDVDDVGSRTATWNATGTANLSYDVGTYTPPTSTIVTTPGTPGMSAEVQLTLSGNGPGGSYTQNDLPYTGVVVPNGVSTYQENNYYAGGQVSPCYLFYGLTDRYDIGSTSEVCQWVQDALNYINDSGIWTLPNGHLPVDGLLSDNTSSAIKAFQSHYGTLFTDGCIDSEFNSVLATQIMRTNRPYDAVQDYHRFYDWIPQRALKGNISDGNSGTIWAKKSMALIPQYIPAYVWDVVMIQFSQGYDIHSITVVPYVDPGGQASTMRVDAWDIRSNFPGGSLAGYSVGNMNRVSLTGSDNSPIIIPVNPAIHGDTVLVLVGQDQVSYSNGSKSFGIRDLYANTTVTTAAIAPTTSTVTTPGYTSTNTVTTPIAITASGTATLSISGDYSAQAQPVYSGQGTISNVVWNGVTTNDPLVTANISSGGLVTLHLTSAPTMIFDTGEVTVGPVLPSPPDSLTPLFMQTAPLAGAYYSMDVTRRVHPIQETGFVSKDDGIKLLCDIGGNPVGFPAVPTSSLTQTHNVSLSLVSYGTDSSVQLSFFDISKNEFITNAQGLPEMSYIDYASRGPQNIYIGMYSASEIDTITSLPGSDDSPPIPFRVIMPAYGLQNSAGAKISLEKLPDNLGQDDIWPISVKPGKFHRQIAVPSQASTAITTLLSPYQGSVVTAYYSVPEASQGGWSPIYGPPNVDVIDEFPLILSETLIQVRQPPILLIQQPTIYSTDADPVRPILAVSIRQSVTQSWTQLPWSDIADYNVHTGEIYLNVPVPGNDPNLVKVSYTTSQNTYYFKEYNGVNLNLNPYSGQNSQFLNIPLYVYMVPQYMKDSSGNIISASQQTRTLRYATSGSVFNIADPSYDPTAVLLGIIYVTTNLNLEDLVILDTRRRGGGAKDAVSDDALVNILSEAEDYWDVNYGTGMSYQKGGFIVLRLPTDLHNNFTTQQIRDVIDRNITVGVQYRIEDLSGNDW